MKEAHGVSQFQAEEEGQEELCVASKPLQHLTSNTELILDTGTGFFFATRWPHLFRLGEPSDEAIESAHMTLVRSLEVLGACLMTLNVRFTRVLHREFDESCERSRSSGGV